MDVRTAEDLKRGLFAILQEIEKTNSLLTALLVPEEKYEDEESVPYAELEYHEDIKTHAIRRN